jgi:uncharacterized SAM-binding protein YcdF (DUF218 family)
MLFLLSKLGGDLVRPSVLLLSLSWTGLGLMSRWGSVWGWRLLVTGLAGYLLILLLPLDSWALLPLEDRFPRPAQTTRIDGIVVLSGAVDTEISRDRGIPSLNDAAERMTEAVALARHHPEARIVFTGASSAIIPGGPTEVDGARQLFSALGLDLARITFEDRARNTIENARNSRALVRPAAGEHWLLVTSAKHEPRAMGVFRHIGWQITAWPIAYKSCHSLCAWTAMSFLQRLSNLDAAAHEWVGLLTYRLIGWTDAWFPAPQDAVLHSSMLSDEPDGRSH